MKTRKILALLLAMVMVLGLCSMASAAAPNDKVQINNMMVDASKVDLASFGLSAEEEIVPVETFAATATYSDLDVNANLPPIKKILIQGFNERDISSNVGIMQGNAIYTLTMPSGTKATQLTNKVVTFVLGGTSTTPTGSTINLTYNGTTYSATAGGSISITMTLTPNVSTPLTATWTALNSDGSTTAKNRSCQLTAYVPVNTTDVSVSEIKVIGEDNGKEPRAFTAGGVTRYSCNIGLEKVTTLTGLTVDVTLGSSNANATLGGVSGTKVGNKITFTNVDFTSSKELVVTNTTYTRTYVVSAYLKGQDVTVYIAIRTYTVSDWLDGTSTTSTNYYDYVANGYGSGADLSAAERSRISNIASALAGNNAPNAPIQSVGNKRIFDEDSYVALDVPAGSSVMAALIKFLNDNNLSANINSEGSYVSSMGTGTATAAQIGEFDCGSASGWMYTARNAVDDLDTPLPNAGANTWPVYNGMFIDWYYTAAYGADFGYSMFDL